MSMERSLLRWDEPSAHSPCGPDEKTVNPRCAANRIVLAAEGLACDIEKLQAVGAAFRSRSESGLGGQQIQIEDPDGNPIELHQLA
jgi:hypothetical protein